MAFNLQSPTVLESFIYSLAAATGVNGTQRHRQVCDDSPLQEELPCTIYDIMSLDPETARSLYLLSDPIAHREP
jgi:hypothetical protein